MNCPTCCMPLWGSARVGTMSVCAGRMTPALLRRPVATCCPRDQPAACDGTEGEHPVSAKCRGLQNRYVRWWMLGAPHGHPIFTSLFDKMRIFQVHIAFQPRFSCVSAALQPRFRHWRSDFFVVISFVIPNYPRFSTSNSNSKSNSDSNWG